MNEKAELLPEEKAEYVGSLSKIISFSMGSPLPKLQSSQRVSDDPKSLWTIPPANPYLSNSHFPSEDVRNAEATYGNSTLGKIAPHVNTDRLLEVIIC